MRKNIGIWISRTWSRFKSSYYVPLSLFFYKTDVSEGYLKLKTLLDEIKHSEPEKDFSHEEINTLVCEAKEFEKYSIVQKNSEILQWRTAIPGIVILILALLKQQFNADSPEALVIIVIVLRYIAILAAIVLTWNAIASMGLIGRRISFCRSAIFEMRVLLDYRLDFFQLEKKCVEKTGRLTKAFSSVTQQEIKHMLIVLIFLVFTLVITAYHEYEILKNIYINYLKF